MPYGTTKFHATVVKPFQRETQEIEEDKMNGDFSDLAADMHHQMTHTSQLIKHQQKLMEKINKPLCNRK